MIHKAEVEFRNGVFPKAKDVENRNRVISSRSQIQKVPKGSSWGAGIQDYKFKQVLV